MKEMTAGGFPEILMDEIYLMAEENETAIDFSFIEKQGTEGSDETLDEKTYDLQQQQQCSTNVNPVRVAPVKKRTTQSDRRKLLRAIEKTNQPLSDKMLNRVIAAIRSS